MDQLPSKRQSSAQDIANVDDVEKLLQKLEETIKGCTKLVGNLTEVRDDTVQCEKIARFFDAKLRIFLTRLQSKREAFAVLRDSDVSDYFQEMATQQRLLGKQLEKIQTGADINEIIESFTLFAQILEAICATTA